MKPDDKIFQLESKITSQQQDIAKMRKDLKRAHLANGIYQAIREEMIALVTPFEGLPQAKVYPASSKATEETLVAHFSDLHADEVVEPHKVGGLECFNFPVACCRAEKHIDTIINFTQNNLSNYNFKRLVVFANGDMTSGTIHDGEGRSYYGNMFRNALAIGQLLGLMIRDLAPHFPTIDVICTSGNHGRRTPKKDYDGAWSNWDYLIYEIASMVCKDIKNVKFQIPDCWSVNVEIDGYGFCVAHGDDIKSWNGIPYYGIERKTRRLIALHNSTGQRIQYFVFGHFHAMTMAAELKGETIINGAYPATDPYVYEGFSGYREPMQLIHGLHPKNGITWRLPIKIKDPINEARGPQRYSAILAQPGLEGLG